MRFGALPRGPVAAGAQEDRFLRAATELQALPHTLQQAAIMPYSDENCNYDNIFMAGYRHL